MMNDEQRRNIEHENQNADMSRTMLQIVDKIKKLVEIDQHAVVE